MMMMMIFDEGVGVGNLRSVEQFIVHIRPMMSRVMVVMESEKITRFVFLVKIVIKTSTFFY